MVPVLPGWNENMEVRPVKNVNTAKFYLSALKGLTTMEKADFNTTILMNSTIPSKMSGKKLTKKYKK